MLLEALKRSNQELFESGPLFVSSGVKSLRHEEWLEAFFQHTQGIWPHASQEQLEANKTALLSGGVISNTFQLESGVSLVITTGSDRSCTLLRLPEEAMPYVNVNDPSVRSHSLTHRG